MGKQIIEFYQDIKIQIQGHYQESEKMMHKMKKKKTIYK